jgi:hypothetical protein
VFAYDTGKKEKEMDVILIVLTIAMFVAGLAIYVGRVYANITITLPDGKKKFAKPNAAAVFCHNEFVRMALLHHKLRFTKTDEDCIAFEVLGANGSVGGKHTFTGQPKLISSLRTMLLEKLADPDFSGLRTN